MRVDGAVLLEFRVRGNPIAQPRPRAVMAGGHARIHELTRVKGQEHPIVGWRQAVAQAARAALGHFSPITVPVVVSALFLLPRPTGMVWKKRPMERSPHASRPDLDNLMKAVMDAMSPKRGAGAWVDDALVAGYGDVQKLYCEAGWGLGGQFIQEPAGALVQVRSADGMALVWETSTGWSGDIPW